MTCAMRPPSSFRLAEKKMVRARARRKGRQRDEPLYSSVARHRDRRTWYSSGAKSMPRLSTPSRVQERGEIPVRSTMERQRNAGFQTTPHCASGDPGCSLGFPPLRGVQRTLPLVAFLWSTRTVSFRERKEMGLDLRRSVTANTKPPEINVYEAGAA